MADIELVILVGIPGSGKTTFFRRRLEGRYVRVSLDNWRGRSNVRAKERLAIAEGLERARQSAGALRGVVVDNTNITRQTRRRYFELAAEMRASAAAVRVVAYWFDEPLERCLARNESRPIDAAVGEPYFVPAAAIVGFARSLEPPRYEEGFAEILRVVVRDGDFELTPVARDGRR